MTTIALLLPDLRGGGAERVTVNLANVLSQRGFRVDLVVMQRHGELLSQVDQRVRVVDLRAPRVRNSLRPLIGYLASSRPTVLLANMWPLPVVTLAARALSCTHTRIVKVAHTTWTQSELFAIPLTRTAIKFSMRLFYPHLDGIVAVSHGVADDLSRISGLPRERITTIYNPIVGTIRPEAGPVALPDHWVKGAHDKILAVGTLKTIKDYPTLLLGLARLRETREARLLILGEGDERSRLESLAAALGLSDVVSMPGFVADTRPYYAAADLFVLSSTGEGLPTVMVEALEQGVPVVSTDCPSGPREILDGDKYGALVPVGDADALARAMETSLASEHDRDALKRRAQDFSVDKAADAYLDLALPGWREGPR